MHGRRDRFSLSLVIPAYNEAAGIRAAIDEADEVLVTLCRRYEILIVDDGSSDDTYAAACAAARDLRRVHIVRHRSNCGYGAALRTGFTVARSGDHATTGGGHAVAGELRLLKGAVMAKGYEPIRQRRVRTRAHRANPSLDKTFRHGIPPRAHPA